MNNHWENRPQIKIDGEVFEVRRSDGEIYHTGRRALARCLTLDTRNEEMILNALHEICGVIDWALGEGAVKRIVGDTPVSLAKALKILNAVLSECWARYAGYIQKEYIGGGQSGKIQPVQP